MTLQFSPYQVLDPSQYQKQRVDPNAITQPLMQGLQMLLQAKQQERQNSLQDQTLALQKEEAARKARADEQQQAFEYGTKLPPLNPMTPGSTDMQGTATGQIGKSSFMPGGQGPVGTGGLVGQFRDWQERNKNRADVSAYGIQPEQLASAGMGDLSEYSDIGQKRREQLIKLAALPSEIRYKNAQSAVLESPAKLQPMGATTGTLSWDTATPTQQNMAKSMVEGNIKPGDLGMRDRATIVGLANEYAIKNGVPFQSYGADVKAGMAKNLAYGKMGMNSLSLNTALGHVNDALDAYQKVGNLDQAYLNKPINWLRENTNDPNVISLGLNLDALQGELATVFKNSSGTDQEIAKWGNYLNTNLTPAQFQAAAQKIGELLRSRLSAMEYQQDNVMTQPTTQRQLLSPKGEKVMKRLEGGPSSGMTRIRDSQGGMHDIPTAKLDAAKKRDPGLQVVQ